MSIILLFLFIQLVFGNRIYDGKVKKACYIGQRRMKDVKNMRNEDDLNLSEEILELLGKNPSGLTSVEIYKKSQLAESRQQLQRQIGGMRRGGNITAVEKNGEKVFSLTPAGKKKFQQLENNGSLSSDDLNAIEEPRISLENTQWQHLSDAMAAAGKQANHIGRLKLVASPDAGKNSFWCSLSARGYLMMNIPQEDGKMLLAQLSEEQVAVLWDYLSRIYPQRIRVDYVETEEPTKEDK